jgi:hypothetical protein
MHKIAADLVINFWFFQRIIWQSTSFARYRKLLLAALCETWVNGGRFPPLREGAVDTAWSLWNEQRLCWS